MPNIDFPGSLNIVFVMCILMNLIFLHETETNSFIACWRSSNSDWKPVPWCWKMASLKPFWHSQINWSPEIYYYMIVLSTFGPFSPSTWIVRVHCMVEDPEFMERIRIRHYKKSTYNMWTTLNKTSTLRNFFNKSSNF